MARYLSLLVILLFAAGLACNLPPGLRPGDVDPLSPGSQDPPLVTDLDVRPQTGGTDQPFKIDVIYETTAQTGMLTCKYPAMDGTPTQSDYQVTELGDNSLHWEFGIRVEEPGTYTVECGPIAGGGVLQYTFTVEAPLRFARLNFNTGSGTYSPDLETVRPATWCLSTSFPPADPEDTGLITVSSGGELSGHFSVGENDVGLMPHEVTLTGEWDRDTNKVTYVLKVSWHWPLGGTQSEQTVTGSGSFATATQATGAAELTITCLDGQGDPDYEPLGCYGDYGGPYWAVYTVTGSVPWSMEFSP